LSESQNFEWGVRGYVYFAWLSLMAQIANPGKTKSLKRSAFLRNPRNLRATKRSLRRRLSIGTNGMPATHGAAVLRLRLHGIAMPRL